MTIILLTIIAMLTYALYDCIKQRDIYYSNYKNCLMALAEHDKELAEYLEKEDIYGRRNKRKVKK